MFLTTCLRQIVGRWISDNEFQLIIDTARELRIATPQLATVWAGDVRGHLFAAAVMLRDGQIMVVTDEMRLVDEWDHAEHPRYGRMLPESSLRCTRRNPPTHNLSKRQKHGHARMRSRRRERSLAAA